MCKSDAYLTLCLEQAAKSPLRFRHGAIVVRGGKVIGAGFNDYRTGFNGGALKHGRIAGSALAGSAMEELKEKLKKPKPNNGKGCTFVPFESAGSGGGHASNQPLSMHGEMMAIHSALSASSTLAATAAAREKPCFKLPRTDKRKARLRTEVLKRYVEAVCGLHPSATATSTAAQGTAKWQVFHHGNKSNNNNNKEEDQEEVGLREEREFKAPRQHAQQSGVQHVVKECQRAFHAPLRGGKHHLNQTRKEKNQKKEKDQKGYQYGQYDRLYGLQIQRHQQHSSARSSERREKVFGDNDDDHVKRKYESTVHDVMTDMGRVACDDAKTMCKCTKDYKRSGKMKIKPIPEPEQPQPILLPKGHAGPSFSDRRKHPRLLGADLYVARLGWCKGNPAADGLPTIPAAASPNPRPPPPSPPGVDDTASSLSDSLSNMSISTGIGTGGSLHDELTHSSPPASADTPPAQQSHRLDPDIIRASRPCYRCISYMSSVGIKRVFWTNDRGEWEGGKVRDLVDNLEESMEAVATSDRKGKAGGDGGITGNGVFVTKHEVLMLRRLMGEGPGT